MLAELIMSEDKLQDRQSLFLCTQNLTPYSEIKQADRQHPVNRTDKSMGSHHWYFVTLLPLQDPIAFRHRGLGC